MLGSRFSGIEKAVVAVVGAAVTSALAIFPQGTATWNALTILSAALTALGVYLVPTGTKDKP